MTDVSLRHFPSTVLIAIFAFFCAYEPIRIPFRRTDKHFVLMLVCRRWDLLVRSTNILWNDILFTPPDSRYPSPDIVLIQLTRCITRGGSELLTIAFVMGRYEWPFSIVRAVIVPHIHRIRHLTCSILTNSDILRFLAIPRGQFSALESINICFADTWDSPVSVFPFNIHLVRLDVFREAHRLRAASLELLNGLNPLRLHLPWGRLAYLDLGAMPIMPETFVDIVCHGSQLQDAFFQIEFTTLTHSNIILFPQEILMYNLKRLRLRLIHPSNDIRLFSVLRLPAIVDLRVEMYAEYQDWDVSIYSKLLSASSDTLQHLRLSDYPPPAFSTIHEVEINQPNYVVKRRDYDTPDDTLEELFKIITKVKTLYLPIGVEVPVPVMEKLVMCDLLPELHMLELGTAIDGGRYMLSVLQRRYEYVSFGLGASSVTGRAPEVKPTFIQYLHLFTPEHLYLPEEEDETIAQMKLLLSLRIIVRIQPINVLPLPVMN